MTQFHSQVTEIVDSFVAQITELARRTAIDTLSATLGSGAGKGGATKQLASRGRGVKRSPDELETLANTFARFVRDNPGLRIEQINKQLGTTTSDLRLPIAKLIGDGSIKAKGQKRSTQYFAK